MVFGYGGVQWFNSFTLVYSWGSSYRIVFTNIEGTPGLLGLNSDLIRDKKKLIHNKSPKYFR